MSMTRCVSSKAIMPATRRSSAYSSLARECDDSQVAFEVELLRDLLRAPVVGVEPRGDVGPELIELVLDPVRLVGAGAQVRQQLPRLRLRPA